jgi:two-component system chemotaxis sensor kinase CheA
MNAPMETFQEEAEEVLADLEAALLELEERPNDMELVDRAFRAMHTIKGAGGMFGFDRLAAFTHHLETAFDGVRNGELEVGKELIDIGLGARDLIRALLDQPTPTPELETAVAALLKRLSAYFGQNFRDDSARPVRANPPIPDRRAPAQGITLRIRIKPADDAFIHGMDLLPVLRELADLGPCHITTLTGDVPPLDRLEAERCHLACDVILTTDRGRDAVEDVFIFVQDDWCITVEAIDDGAHSGEAPSERAVGEILVRRGDAAPEHVREALSQQKRTGEILTEHGHVTPDKVRSALAEQTLIRERHQQRLAKENAAHVKVPADRLDSLMDLVGELVISQARLSQTANGRDDPELVSIAEEMERLTTELRDTTLELRMLPIGTTFARFRRLVRDLAAELGKEIELVTEGAETELDKTVIDRLGDPLVHLIRNSVDHGIEAPDTREFADKPRKGTVRLSATHSESHVLICIKDDGAGLDAQAIRAKAVERGLISPDTELADDELFNLIFEPGFSTAKAVSKVSGRGVGMDVVRRSIESLRGKVRIDSDRGKGTTVTVELPLTLAIIEGLLVQVAKERYVLPLSLVEECIERTQVDSAPDNGNRLVEVRGELVPYLRLREWFNEGSDRPDIEQIVVTRLGETRFGFSVDQVIGQHQTVIKTLGKLYEGVEGLAGATILGDGGLALILDAAKLVHAASPGSAVLH